MNPVNPRFSTFNKPSCGGLLKPDRRTNRVCVEASPETVFFPTYLLYLLLSLSKSQNSTFKIWPNSKLAELKKKSWPKLQLVEIDHDRHEGRAAGVSHDSPRTPNVHISGPRRFKHHQNSTKRPPRERKKKEKCGGGGKKSAKFWAHHPSGPQITKNTIISTVVITMIIKVTIISII